jgi:anti-repressor protein
MTELIKIEEKDGKRAVNARELHKVLCVGKDFSSWIKERISKYGFIENQDFEVFTEFGENPLGGRPSKEYALSIDMAKELAMIENNDKGREVRRYFIECEKMLKENTPSYIIDDPIKRAERWIEEEKKRRELSVENKRLAAENEVMKPKSDYFDELVSTDMLTNFRDAAKELGVKEGWFIKFLIDKKYLYRTKSGKLRPYSTHSQDGLFAIRDFTKDGYSGTRTFLTPKGKSHFRVLFGKNNEGYLF